MGTENGMWTDEALKKFLKYLLNHTVAIAGTYEYTTGPKLERAYAFSGCIVSSANHWHVLTAGHAIQDHVTKSRSSKIQITGRVLADCFGEASTHREPLPFDPVTRIDHCKYVTGGIDYAVFTLTNNEVELLKINGIRPFPFRESPLAQKKLKDTSLLGSRKKTLRLQCVRKLKQALGFVRFVFR